MQTNELIQGIKEYNQRLRQKKEEFQRTEVEIQMLEESIQNRCAELTNLLGVQVTKENLQEVYQSYKEKLEEQLQQGLNVLNSNQQVYYMTTTSTTQNSLSATNFNQTQHQPQQPHPLQSNQPYATENTSTQAQATLVNQQMTYGVQENSSQDNGGFDSLEQTSMPTFNSDTVFDENIKMF